MEMYSHLFSRAFEDLLGKQSEKNYLTEDEVKLGRFRGLDHYFAHMGDLFEVNPKYIMLPIDEQTEGLFVIDANTRKIDIPKPFSTYSGVQSDNMCEIVVFTIDRYFDYQDLADTNICVQWIRPGGTPDDEGISHISLIDLETCRGKIRFGWPLTEEITKYPGKVKFAVRFYKKDGNGKFQYVLNTEETFLPIKAGLNIDDPAIEENSIDLFGQFIRNSMNPSYAIPEPAFFVKPGIDLPATAAITYAPGEPEDDTLVLKAQAVANDLGYISYVWKFKPDDGEERVLVNDDTYDIKFDVPVLVTDIAKEAGNVAPYIPLVDKETGKEIKDAEGNVKYTIAKREGGQKYYRPIETDTGVKYQLYYERIDEENPAPEDLVELITTLTLKKDGSDNITGEYSVEAINSIYFTEEENERFKNETPPALSNKCVVPGPNEVELKNDFASHIFMDKVSGIAALTAEPVADPTNPDYVYTWYRSKVVPTSVEDMAVLSGATTETYTIQNEPGWYAAKVKSVLNRKEMSDTSSICRVTHYPEKPLVKKLEYATIRFDDDGVEQPITAWNELKSLNDEEAADFEKTMSDVYKNGDLIRLKITTNFDLDGKVNNHLDSDKIEYYWYVQKPDEERRLITAEDIGPNSIIREGTDIDGAVLDVRCLLNTDAKDQATVYSCQIVNFLGEKGKDGSYSDPYDTANYNTFVVM